MDHGAGMEGHKTRARGYDPMWKEEHHTASAVGSLERITMEPLVFALMPD